MARLSDIVGGLLRDLAESHAVSDAYTREVLEAYRQDPMLSQFPVPRMAIRQATLRLKFAVTGQAPAPIEDDDPTEYRELWVKALRERLLPQALEAVGRLDNKAVVAAFGKRLSLRSTGDALNDVALLLDPQQGPALQKMTIAFLARQVESLSATARRSLEGVKLSQAFQEAAARELPELQRAARRIAEARRAAQAELDIAVHSEDLQGLPESQVSEMELTVSLDDVQFGGDSATTSTS